MPTMSAVEQAFCRSAPWRAFAKRVMLPWALQGHELNGPVLELGGGSGAMTEAMLERFPGITATVTLEEPAGTKLPEDAASKRL